MNTDLAFVGDVHGNLRALRSLWSAIAELGVSQVVFLGDYINKGDDSAAVMREVLMYNSAGHASLLRGNHETALLEALDSGDLTAFLKMGGAMTVRSYIGGDAQPDVLAHFRSSFPSEHLDAIRGMPDSYELDDLVAQHHPPDSSTPKFRISAHTPVGELPRITPGSAHLDTGCGDPAGRLTALLWPDLDYLQVDACGRRIGH